jgi:hypothetical protein
MQSRNSGCCVERKLQCEIELWLCCGSPQGYPWGSLMARFLYVPDVLQLEEARSVLHGHLRLAYDSRAHGSGLPMHRSKAKTMATHEL